ncbi:unnamed protein product [Cochlearia groenlandica]
MRVRILETTISAILDSQKAMLESQKVILATLAIDPDTNQPFATPSPNAATSNSTPQTIPNFDAQSVNREKEDDGEAGVVADGEDEGEEEGGLVRKTLF